MGTKSREVIWSGRIMGAEISAKHAREEAVVVWTRGDDR
jgi:hypothetical protein